MRWPVIEQAEIASREPNLQISKLAAALDRALGTYQYAPDDRIVIRRGLTGLIGTLAPGKLVIYPQSATRFFAKLSDDLLIDFSKSDAGSAKTPTLRQGGKSYFYKRVSDTAP
jgi:hypothetical protein